MSDFSDFLLSQAASDAGASFSSNAPRPYVSGVSQNVLAGSVNVATHPGSAYTPATSNPGGTKGETLGGVPASVDSVSVQQAAMSLYGLSNSEISKLQGQLVSAGYLASRDISTPGVVDGATAKAYGDLLQDTSAYNAAGNPLTINDLLGQRTAARPAAAVNASAAASIPNGRVQQLTPGLDLTDQVQQAARSEYGRKLKPAEVQKFIALYHRLESGQNSQVLAADTAAQTGGNSTIIGAPNAGTSATAFVDDLHPAEAQAHSVAGQFGNLLDILKGI